MFPQPYKAGVLLPPLLHTAVLWSRLLMLGPPTMKLFPCLVAVLLFLFQAAPGKGQEPCGVCIYRVRVLLLLLLGTFPISPGTQVKGEAKVTRYQTRTFWRKALLKPQQGCWLLKTPWSFFMAFRGTAGRRHHGNDLPLHNPGSQVLSFKYCRKGTEAFPCITQVELHQRSLCWLCEYAGSPSSALLLPQFIYWLCF